METPTFIPNVSDGALATVVPLEGCCQPNLAFSARDDLRLPTPPAVHWKYLDSNHQHPSTMTRTPSNSGRNVDKRRMIAFMSLLDVYLVEQGCNVSIFQRARTNSFVQHARKTDMFIHNWILCEGVDGISHGWIKGNTAFSDWPPVASRCEVPTSAPTNTDTTSHCGGYPWPAFARESKLFKSKYDSTSIYIYIYIVY